MYKTLPKVSLGFLPTPLEELNRLSEHLAGPQILIKRDDMTGLALGGNKTRKLEYILADALAQGCDTIVTAGAIQSNHCRQTAAAAAKLGLDCHLVLGGREPACVTGNLLLDKVFGSHIHWCGENRKGEDIPRIVGHLQSQGKKPYVVPYGGSNELGAYAFLAATEELKQQAGSEHISHILFASSSGGTHAGLMLGNTLTGLNAKIIGINIDKDESGDLPFKQHIIKLANNTARHIEYKHKFDQQELLLNDDYIADGYGVLGKQEKEAIRLSAQLEGILLDPVYTGRAMAGLIGMIRSGELTKRDKVLFWHTGGAPALFAYGDELEQG